MKHPAYLSVLLVATLGMGGCVFLPKAHARLDAARNGYLEAQADARLRIDAAEELKEAGELLERAEAARITIDDPALVDHLAYLAKQRVAIAREVAAQKALQRATFPATR